MHSKSNKRIFYFYNRPVQLRYAAFALLIITATIVAYTYILYQQVSEVVGVASHSGFDSEELSSAAMANLITGIKWGSAGCILIAGGVSAFWAMLITHRYEGPIARINAHLRELASGNYNAEFKIRKNDEVQELADTVRDLTAALEKKNSAN